MKYSQMTRLFANNLKRDSINRLRKVRSPATAEMPPPFPNGWYGILESSRLRDGEATFLSCLGEHLVVYRTHTHEVYILDAYCPHLGANLGIGGRVVGDCIECPFHKWSFRGSDGVCTNIPYSTSVPKGSKLKKWISQEVNGYIFIWYHSEPTELPWELSSSMEGLQESFVYQGQNQFFINCHIQEIPENGADLAHFDAIHKKNFIADFLVTKNIFAEHFGHHQWTARWFPRFGKSKHLAEVNLTHALVIFGKYNCFRMDISGKQIGPSFVCLKVSSTLFGNFQVFQSITPIGPFLQKVVHRFYAPRYFGPLIKIFIFGESLMFQRDINVWNNKMFRRNPILAKEDASIKKFRMWFSQFYTSNSKPFTETTTVSW
ncbi:cholesterol 7-desaturase isoform X2 [Drosophila serrata]|nr:cholesterol 7-desaturase isoform X2 [Drosophila serrata]